MVAIKDMAIPSRCDKCFFKGYSECLLTKTFIIDETRRAENCPLVEIEERKGKWIKEKDVLGWDGYSYQCSICGRSIHLDTEVEDLEDYPYCHCGAEMEIGEDGKWIND